MHKFTALTSEGLAEVRGPLPWLWTTPINGHCPNLHR